MSLQEKKYEKYTLYTFDESFFPILEKIVKKEYTIEEELKNDYKSYVLKIICDDKCYILKKMLFRKKRKKYLTFFRKGDCLKILLNVKNIREQDCEELADIYGVGIYKKGLIHDQFMIMEYATGRPLNAKEDYSITEKILKKLHKLGICHGDPHPDNFIMGKNKIIVLDTRLKKICFGNYQAHRDMLLFQEKFGVMAEYPYKKNLFYHLCCLKKKLTARL